MSVLLETSVGDITIDLLVKEAPKACENFLKLCLIKYYNYSPIYNVQSGFSFQTGDPIGPESKDSDGGSSIWGLPNAQTNKKATRVSRMTFEAEISNKQKHVERGTVSLATTKDKIDPDKRLAASQFIITLGDNVDQLDGKALIFGKVVEGFECLEKINTSFVDEKGRPLKDIRILHTIVLDDPFPDIPDVIIPPSSPIPSKEQLATVRIAHDEDVSDNMDPEAMERLRRERDAKAQALTLELLGDLPFAEVTPPEQILFVCKLNPVTQDEDLELIFSRFGKILSCEVIRDKKTGDSLQYAFIEFGSKEDCERAYFNMQGVLIDDHRIHVDFSQSVSKLADSWRDVAKSKTAKRKGGYGGIDGLEKKRQYRDFQGNDRRGDDEDYRYVFDKKDNKRSRSNSPHRGNERSTQIRRERSPHRKDKRRYDDGRNNDERDDRRYNNERDDRRYNNERDDRRYNDRGDDRRNRYESDRRSKR